MKTLSLVATLALVLLAQPGALAQEEKKQGPRRPSGLALEIGIRGVPPGYQSVPGESFGGRYRRIGGATPPSEEFEVRVVDEMEGDAVRVRISGYLDKFRDREMPIASYLLREGERVTVAEMTNVGFEPFELAVVRVKREERPTPTATSRAASVEVVGVEAKGSSNFPAFNVALRNLSAKGITYLEVRTYGDNGRTLTVSWPRGELNRPLIEAGGVGEVSVRGGGLAVKDEEGVTPNAPRRIEVVAAVFSDGTFEGEGASATKQLAALRGQRTQLARVLALLREAAEARGDEGARLAVLKEGASALGREHLQADVDELAAAFPSLSPTDRDALKHLYQMGLDKVRKELLKDIQEFGSARAQDTAARPFAAWLADLAQKYEAWLSRV